MKMIVLIIILASRAVLMPARPVLMLLSSEPALMLAIRLMLMLTRPGLMLASKPAVLMPGRAADQLEHHLLSG